MRKILKNILSTSPYVVYKKYRDKMINVKRIKVQKEIIDDYLKNNEVKKLQIGCGTNIMEGWLNTDLKDTNSIAFLDAGKVYPIKSDIFDFIYSEHLFEHLKIEQQINMLEECHRILKKGGVMRIATPSLDFLFNLYSNPDTFENQQYVIWAMKNIPNLNVVKDSVVDNEEYYTHVINNFFKAWGHQMIHNYSSIKKLALQCGFNQVKQFSVGDSDILTLRNIERHGTIIPKRINLIETMIIEITK